MQIELKGSLMTDRTALHDLLKTQLQLPEYYGRNLDALFDLLTERKEATEIVVTDWAEVEINLGGYAASLMDTLYDAAKENPVLTVKVK